MIELTNTEEEGSRKPVDDQSLLPHKASECPPRNSTSAPHPALIRKNDRANRSTIVIGFLRGHCPVYGTLSYVCTRWWRLREVNACVKRSNVIVSWAVLWSIFPGQTLYIFRISFSNCHEFTITFANFYIEEKFSLRSSRYGQIFENQIKTELRYSALSAARRSLWDFK